MTKFKCTLYSVNILEVQKQTSKRGNTYLILKSIYDNEEINFYFPDFDSDLDFNNLVGIHDLDIQITISKYSHLQVLKVK